MKAKAAHNWPKAADSWYVEPPWVTRLLLQYIDRPRLVWDPCAGGGNVIAGCQAEGVPAVGSDLRQRYDVPPPWFIGQRDFLAADPPVLFADAIISNPPYGGGVLLEAFIRRALSMGPALLAVYCEMRFLGGEGRALGLFRDHPPSGVVTVSPRPNCPPGVFLQNGGKAEGGSQDFCWLVWRKDPLGVVFGHWGDKARRAASTAVIPPLSARDAGD